MATKYLPGGRKVTAHVSTKSSGGRKTKTFIVSVKGKRASATFASRLARYS